ncbi:hypothetical protein DZF91_04195 [Actinomadura logoneensis]|uniref:Uncharacterized protein n=1 Tax=Actinomadura logoneensis TaxID=2293572 RepID=A0A372JU63_9ACTN|nr:hypothetical protein DZF91_04195 [Actinomadura logoneensis]
MTTSGSAPAGEDGVDPGLVPCVGDDLPLPGVPEPLSDAVGVGTELELETGLLEAFAPPDPHFISSGTAMSAAMTKKTAAMTTLGNCIVTSGPAALRDRAPRTAVI